mgnify:CR=1 FL=1
MGEILRQYFVNPQALIGGALLVAAIYWAIYLRQSEAKDTSRHMSS